MRPYHQHVQSCCTAQKAEPCWNHMAWAWCTQVPVSVQCHFILMPLSLGTEHDVRMLARVPSKPSQSAACLLPQCGIHSSQAPLAALCECPELPHTAVPHGRTVPLAGALRRHDGASPIPHWQQRSLSEEQ